VEVLRQVDDWPAQTTAVGVLRGGDVVATHGPRDETFRWASVTKLATALAVLVAAEEGVLDLDQLAGPPGSTVRHLLAHASGLPFEGEVPIARVGERRIYSNGGFEALAEELARAAEMPFGDYLRAAVLEPLGLGAELRGSPASGLQGTLGDLLRLGAELQRPALVAPETLTEAITVQFPGLVGVLPDVGRMDPNDWGLGFELRDAKSPHWTGTRNSPSTFGHFGGTGSFLWVDPKRVSRSRASATSTSGRGRSRSGPSSLTTFSGARCPSVKAAAAARRKRPGRSLRRPQGVSARTDAVLGTFIARATSPK
jgi:CubicO group peptidase (beta-lactamase class C family)